MGYILSQMDFGIRNSIEVGELRVFRKYALNMVPWQESVNDTEPTLPDRTNIALYIQGEA